MHERHKRSGKGGCGCAHGKAEQSADDQRGDGSIRRWLFLIRAEIMADDDGSASPDHGIKRCDHAGELAGRADSRHRVVREEREHEGVDSAHKVHQEHFQEKGDKNAGQRHGALRCFHSA